MTLVFSSENILDIIKILRTDNDIADNCTHVASDLVTYFKTGIIPTTPSITTPSTSIDFDVLTTSDWIKKENGTKYLGMVKSTVCLDNTSISNIPCDILPTQLPDGTLDLDSELINVDNFTQRMASITHINNCLKNVATENGQGISFGFICIGRCGKYIDKAGHMLVYFATEVDVMYIDAQLYNGIDQIDNGCIFSDLTDRFEFADTKKINIDVFGEYVFYIPIGPKTISDMELINVKLEESNDISIVPVFTKKKVCHNQKCEHGRKKSTCKDCNGGGICEHSKIRSSCKECKGGSICEHNRYKSSCKDCKGGARCEHDRVRSICKECGGGSICEHNRIRSVCIDCGGASICEHKRIKSACKDCKGSGICEHNRHRSICKDCKGGGICEHNKSRSRCKDCNLVRISAGRKCGSICEHNSVRSACKKCHGGSICEHDKIRSTCKECKGGSICEHENIRSLCKECKKLKKGGGSICEHGRNKVKCKDCHGNSRCKHNRMKDICKECGGKGLCEHGRAKHICVPCGGASICEHSKRRCRCAECKEIKKRKAEDDSVLLLPQKKQKTSDQK